MTIFLEIAKYFIINTLTEIRDNSILNDGGLGNFFLNKIGLGRDTELSKTKRELIDVLIADIRNFEDQENDELTFSRLNALIAQCRTEAKKRSDEKGYDEGALGPAMKILSDFLEQ